MLHWLTKIFKRDKNTFIIHNRKVKRLADKNFRICANNKTEADYIMNYMKNEGFLEVEDKKN